MTTVNRVIADFWFDPSCPYTWLTARWLVEVTTVRPVEVRWHVMSLSVLNEGRDDDPEGDPDGYLWVPVRVCAAVARHHGQEALGRFYRELWGDQEEMSSVLIGDLAAALERAGLPRVLAAAGAEYDDAVRASHRAGINLVGTHVGTPIIATTGPGGDRVAWFGPVISRFPSGQAAGRLWDGTVLVAATPGFHELKGTPHAEPER